MYLLQDLFAGKVRSFISCTNVSYESARDEDFYDIQLDVKGCKNVYESLKKYTESEMLEGDNQYDAGPEFGKQDARKGVIFMKLPPVLTIHLKRFELDNERACYKKVHDHFEFPSWLDLDPYLAQDSEQKGQDNEYIVHSVLVHSGDFGGGHYYAYIRPTSDLFDYAAARPKMQKKADQCKMEYHANHPDSATNGANAAEGEGEGEEKEKERMPEDVTKDAGRMGKWYKFDDAHVYAVEDEEALDYCYGRLEGGGINNSLSSAYMLVYVNT